MIQSGRAASHRKINYPTQVLAQSVSTCLEEIQSLPHTTENKCSVLYTANANRKIFKSLEGNIRENVNEIRREGF